MIRKILVAIVFFMTLHSSLYAQTPTQENVTKLYIAFFDRAPDADGLDYWVNKSHISLEEIAMSFFDQIETREKYPNGLTDADFIIEVYANLFGRKPDSEGFDYWLKALKSNNVSRSVFILAMVNGAQGDDKKLLDNKTEVGLAFAKAGHNNIDKAKGIMEGVTADHDSVAKVLYKYGLGANPNPPEPTPPGPTPPANHPPVADAGTDQTGIATGTNVDLNGSASSDPDGDTLTYAWSMTGKPAGSTAALSGDTTKYPSFTPDIAGDYNISLVVNDGKVDSAPDSVTVTAIVCINPVTHNGTEYCEVTSATGKVWLDRNLGATQVCTALDDTACYGDYYQWGRNFDGHQDSGSGTTSTLATDVNSAGSEFITNSNFAYDWASVDSNGSIRSANWSKTDGSSVCPVGYRVPTIAELEAERLSWATNDSAGAFASPLKWPSGGFRTYYSGQMDSQGSYGVIWSSTVSGSASVHLIFSSGGAYTGDTYRANGLSARCIKGPIMIINDNFDSDAVGSLPSGWTIKYGGTGTANQKVVSSPYVSPNHSFQLEGKSGWAANIYKTPSTIPDSVTIESNIYIDKSVSGESGWFSLYNKDEGAWGTQVGGLQFKDGKFSAHYTDGDYYIISNFTPQQWYHVAIKYNNTEKTYKIYIDDTLVSGVYNGTSYNEFPMHPSVSPAQIMLTAGNGGTVKVFYDDVKMY